MSGSGVLMLLLGSSIVFLLMGLALVLFIMQYQKKTISQSEELQNSKMKHQQQMLAATIESQEAERKRIAANLHDSLGAQLSTIRMFLLMQGEENEGVKPFAEESGEMLLQSIQEVREIAQDLLPSALKYGGLKSACSQFLENTQNSTPLQINTQYSGVFIRLSEKSELSIFRIIQELVNNTLKHAEASIIDVELIYEEDNLFLNYSDNGKGMTKEKQNQGLGMYNIASRVQSLKGKYTCESTPRNGVHFAIKIPITQSLISK